MSNLGLVVSKPGFDATDDTTRQKFNSNNATYSILRQEDRRLGSSGTTTIPHGLSYIPRVWINAINAYNSNNDARIPVEIVPVLSEESVDYKVDKNSLKIKDDVSNRNIRIIIFTRDVRG